MKEKRIIGKIINNKSLQGWDKLVFSLQIEKILVSLFQCTILLKKMMEEMVRIKYFSLKRQQELPDLSSDKSLKGMPLIKHTPL